MPRAKSIVLVKNPRYWDASAIHLAGIDLHQRSHGPQQLTSLESGLVEVEGIPDNDIPALKAQSNLQSNSLFPDASYFFVPICKSSGTAGQRQGPPGPQLRHRPDGHQQRPPLRQGRTGLEHLPVLVVLLRQSLTNVYAFNLKKAKALLAQAGYPHGFSTSIMALPEAPRTSWPRCSKRSGSRSACRSRSSRPRTT